MKLSTWCCCLQAASAAKNLPEDDFWNPGSADGSCEPRPHNILLPAVGEAPDAADEPADGRSDAGGTSVATKAPGGGGGAEPKRPRALTAVASRGLQWLSWARACVGDDAFSSDVKDFDRVATLLAAQRPYRVRLCDIRIVCPHGTLADSELPVVANGSLVGLITSQSYRQHPQQPAPVPMAVASTSGRLNTSMAPLSATFDATAAAAYDPSDPTAPPLPCLGIGLVRGVDLEKGLLYLLAPLDGDSLQVVDVLQVGCWHPAAAFCCIAGVKDAGKAVHWRHGEAWSLQRTSCLFCPPHAGALLLHTRSAAHPLL